MMYNKIKELVNGKELPLLTNNEDGEPMVVSTLCDEEFNTVYKVSTYQENGWIRINLYHRDGTIEELYEKGDL